MDSDSPSSGPSSIRKRLLLVVQAAIGIGALWVLVEKVELERLLAVAGSINVWWAIGAFLAFPVVYAWTIFGHRFLLRVLEAPTPMRWFIRVMLLTQALGMVAPGKLGDFSIAWFLKRRGVSYSRGLAVAMNYKLIAVAVNAWLGLVAISLLSGKLAAIAAAVVGPIIVALLGHRFLCPFLEWWYRRFGTRRTGSGLAEFVSASTRLIQRKTLLPSILIGVGKTIFLALTPYLLFQAFGHPIAFELVVLVGALVRMATMIPLSPSGIGVRELSGTYLFSHYTAVTPEIAANVMIVSLVYQIIFSALCYFGNLRGFEIPSKEVGQQ